MKRAAVIFAALLMPIALAGCIPLNRYLKATSTPAATTDVSATPEITPEPQGEAEATPTPTPTPTETVSERPGYSYTPPASAPATVRVVVDKSDKILSLYGDDELIGTFPVRLGKSAGAKRKDGDEKTPEGDYYICTRNDQTQYTLFLGISYPNSEDAKYGYNHGTINKATYDSIVAAIDAKQRPSWATALGGSIGIRGGYDGGLYTNGCIAVSDEDIRVLWDYLQIGTVVSIVV